VSELQVDSDILADNHVVYDIVVECHVILLVYILVAFLYK
jgi:hypothetical protein